MLKLEGQVLNVFKAPDFTPREGEKKEGGHKVQIMAEMVLKNGQKKIELFTLTVKNPDEYTIGTTAEVPVGAFVRAGQIHYYGLDQ